MEEKAAGGKVVQPRVCREKRGGSEVPAERDGQR